MGKDATRARVSLQALHWFETGIPHELDAFHLMWLQLLDDILVDGHQLLFGLRIKVKDEVINPGIHDS